MMKIDFSAKHNIWLKDRESGLIRRMDEPYFTSKLIADGVWMIESDGCAAFLIEGGSESIMIDTGYGAGDIRAYAQCLTSRPVRRVINTHDHFDHTALNGLFELAIMTEATAPLATTPFKSFDGVEFPTDYKKEIVKHGDVIDIGGRELRIFEIPDHAVGSIAILDSASRILFIGDECSRFGKAVGGSLKKVLSDFRNLQEYRDQFDHVYQNHMGCIDGDIIDRIVNNIEYILNGNEGEPDRKPPFRLPEAEKTPDGEEIWLRGLPYPGDGHAPAPEDMEFIRISNHYDCEIKYDIRCQKGI